MNISLSATAQVLLDEGQRLTRHMGDLLGVTVEETVDPVADGILQGAHLPFLRLGSTIAAINLAPTNDHDDPMAGVGPGQWALITDDGELVEEFEQMDMYARPVDITDAITHALNLPAIPEEARREPQNNCAALINLATALSQVADTARWNSADLYRQAVHSARAYHATDEQIRDAWRTGVFGSETGPRFDWHGLPLSA